MNFLEEESRPVDIFITVGVVPDVTKEVDPHGHGVSFSRFDPRREEGAVYLYIILG